MLATISDSKTGIDVGNGTIDHYEANVLTASDYYPFGMQMPGRIFNSGSYRYGFNGKEDDNEVKGDGNQQDYGMRIYDPRIGKFLSVDPLTTGYPMLTPYQFASNTPIWAIDLDGLEGVVASPLGTQNIIDRQSGFAAKNYFYEPATLKMRMTLAYQVNAESRGVEFTESDFKGLTKGGFYLESAAYSLLRYAQSNPGNLKIPNTRGLPQQPEVEIPSNTFRPKQGVTVSEEVPIGTNKQASFNSEIPFAGANKVKVTMEDGSNFGIKDINYVGGNKNCAYCVIATDHYLKTGYPVSALNKTEVTDPRMLEEYFGAKFTYGLSINQVRKMVGKTGQMGIVYGYYNSKEAHVFNVINQNGKVSLIDGQSGGKANLNGFKWFGFLPTTK